jgi:MoaA/NifB/PqqE/SkfB family radical SAM enzyme
MFWKRRTFPLYVVFFITNRCNANCKHCLLGSNEGPTDDLTIDEIEKISASMDDFLFLLPTGGQPFLRKDLAEIVKIFHRNNHVKNVGIPTNGTMTERTVEIARDVLESCPELDFGIDVSIDALAEDHDEIRGVPGLFEKAVQTYRELKKLEKIYPKFNVNVETTVSAHNDDKLVPLHDFLIKDLKVDTLFTLLTRGKPKDPSSKFFNIDKYEQYSGILKRDIRDRVLSGYHSFPFSDIINAKRLVRHNLIAKTVRENKYQTPCYAGRLGAAIFAQGDVLPCELHTDMIMGNLRDSNYDFRKIWFSPRADEIRRSIHKDRCFCTYECFHTLNILFNPRIFPKVLKEWASIKLGKTKAGIDRMLKGRPEKLTEPLPKHIEGLPRCTEGMKSL